ncbi:MAG: chromosomal replication initiator protein DnaA [Thermodesulfobacteriota bacterium]|nr:chromosomal replication initiator protein DnaA [Thermodesulfobacteriota bacterium]
MPKKNDIWERITARVQSEISPLEFKTWFSHAVLKRWDQDLAIIEVPNKFIAEWLRDNCASQIQDSFRANSEFAPKIQFTYSSPTVRQGKPRHETTWKSVWNSDGFLNPMWTFDNFVTADCNSFAFSSAMEVAGKTRYRYNPLYLFSELGSGKTHLLHAIGHRILSSNPSANVGYLPADRFSAHFSIAAKKQELTKFRENYRNMSCLLLDDIHLLGGREKSQREFIRLFNLFYESKKQIVVAGKHLPSRIHDLLPQLRSRLEWGLLAEIQVPDQKTKRTIIEKTAKEKNLSIPDDVAFFLSMATNDLKILTQYLVSLATYSSLYRHKIDMAIVETIIKNKDIHTISINDIQDLIVGYFNISLADLESNKKRRLFSYPRQIGMYLSRKLTDLSFREIGEAFGGKDHSTVIYAVKCVEKSKEVDKNVLDDINNLNNLLSRVW